MNNISERYFHKVARGFATAARESITVSFHDNTFFVKGSEIAVLRLFYYYRYRMEDIALLMVPYGDCHFTLETSFHGFIDPIEY